MNRLLFLTILLCFGNFTAFSQNLDLSILTVPDALTEDANSIIRFENYTINIASQRDKMVTVESAITIFNKLADDYSDVSIGYDKRTQIKSVKMYVYDAMGKEIKKIKKSDFDDYSASGSNLFTDSRLINYEYTPTSYPYTVYYSYEYKTSNTALLSSWTWNSQYYQSVQKAKFSVHYPAHIDLMKSEKNFEGYPIEKVEQAGLLSYEVANVPAIEYEPNTPRLRDFLPYSKMGLNQFNLEGVDGSANNWEEFGRWYYHNLIKNTLDLPESTKQRIKELCADVSDPLEKAKIVYEYVQNKVRYISVQVGVGGFKPMLASDVDKLSYGDCKGLTNYTSALLDAVDIPSYHALIYGEPDRKLDINADVVAQQGNHMVLYVPINGKDYWLECTSQTTPFAESGDFTDDRIAVVIYPDGGEPKRTKVYDDKENHQNIVGSYELKNDGTISGKVAMVSSGSQFDNHLYYEGKDQKQLDKLYKEFWDNINNMSIEGLTIKNNKKEGKFEETVAFNADSYGAISGERMIFPVNAFNVIESAPKRIRNRKLPVEVTRGFYDVDEVTVSLPVDYTIEAISDAVNLETKYGNYSLKIEKNEDHTLTYKRELLLKTGNYPKEEYNEYRNFWRKVVKADKSKIVLIKN